jgi:thiamine-monophosphate kinase
MKIFADKPGETIAHCGETGLIELIRSWLGEACPPAPFGIGDDCAVIPASTGKNISGLVTVDSVILDRHFTADTPPAAVATKLLRRNLSDIAAMGGTPDYAVIALIADPRLRLAWLEAFYRSLGREACDFKTRIVGGDCAAGPEGFFSAHLTLFGQAEHPVTRKGAAIDDSLWVTGTLGGSSQGHHLDFTPRMEEGRFLASHASVKAMIDITDGLAKDLPALLDNTLAARLQLDAIPCSKEAIHQAEQTGHPAWQAALTDGEDYELLVVMDQAADVAALQRNWNQSFNTRLTCIGTIVSRSPGSPALLDPSGNPLNRPGQGYDHYRSSLA